MREEGESDHFKQAGAAGLFLRSAGRSPVVVTARNERVQIQCRPGGQVLKYPYLPHPLNPPAPDGSEPTPGDFSGGTPDSFWDDQGETCGGAGGGDRYVPQVHGAEPTQPSISVLIPLRAGVNLKLRYPNTRGFSPFTPPPFIILQWCSILT